MEKFILFGKRPFNRYAYQRLLAIEENINTLSDIEVLMYKDNFDDLVKKLVSNYSLLPVNISFEDKLVDLIDKPDKKGSHYFVEYTLMITGDATLLELDPYNNGFIEFPIPVTVKTNVISFEIDTYYASEDIPGSIMKDIKQDYDMTKDYITKTILHLNNESQKFNLKLEEFIIPILGQKMRKAHKHSVIKQKLNFK